VGQAHRRELKSEAPRGPEGSLFGKKLPAPAMAIGSAVSTSELQQRKRPDRITEEQIHADHGHGGRHRGHQRRNLGGVDGPSPPSKTTAGFEYGAEPADDDMVAALVRSYSVEDKKN